MIKWSDFCSDLCTMIVQIFFPCHRSRITYILPSTPDIINVIKTFLTWVRNTSPLLTAVIIRNVDGRGPMLWGAAHGLWWNGRERGADFLAVQLAVFAETTLLASRQCYGDFRPVWYAVSIYCGMKDKCEKLNIHLSRMIKSCRNCAKKY